MNEKVKTEETEETEENQKFRLRSVVLDEDAMFLRRESEPVVLLESGQLDEETQELIVAMKELVLGKDALGLAAAQVGVLKRLFVMRKPFNSPPGHPLIVVVNPRLIRGGPKFSVRAEGCLSIDYFPDHIRGARVKRHSEIYVNYTDQNGADHVDEILIGMDARVFQHELDHLNGKLMIDEPGFQGMERAY